MRSIGAGRWLLSAAAALTVVGGFLADWNRTHLFNPLWPPHAKFHAAQTITLGVLLGTSGLYLLWRKPGDQVWQLRLGTLLPALFWIAQGSSFAFPGARGLEAEFPELVPKIAGVYVNERFSSALMLALLGAGYLLERRR